MMSVEKTRARDSKMLKKEGAQAKENDGEPFD